MYSNKLIAAFTAKKGREKITLLTCYDYSFACALAESDLDMITVGDSMANVVLGMERTNDIGFEEMCAHAAAVKKALPEKPVVVDLPFVCCQDDPSRTAEYARTMVEVSGADAVKIEWYEHCPRVCRELAGCGIPVMGHIGLTPQTADKIGGFKVQGRDTDTALKLFEQAGILEKEGVFSMVLECVPHKLAALLTERSSVPTIGIGSGAGCDGQVLVLYDMLGLYRKKRPKFVREYTDLYSAVQKAVAGFCGDVKKNDFPAEEESYRMPEDELKKIKNILNKNGI